MTTEPILLSKAWPDSSGIYTAEETRIGLRIDNAVTLENMRRRKIIKGFRQGREWYYTGYCIKQYLIAKGVLPCEESQDSLNFKIDKETLNRIAGTSNTTEPAEMEESEVDAHLRGIKLARKTMKQTSRSPVSH